MWTPIVCPSTVKISRIEKERGCHGRVFVVQQLNDKRCCFVCQSLPAIVAFLNRFSPTRFHVSSFYRTSRLNGAQQSHRGWIADALSCDETEKLNWATMGFDRVAFLTRQPENWILTGPEPEHSPEPSIQCLLLCTETTPPPSSSTSPRAPPGDAESTPGQIPAP